MPSPLPDADRFGGRRAVILGGSLAGLFTARVLSEHFDEVTVVERDALPDGSVAPRKGVPQGRQLHGLLKRGEDVIEDLFPGIVAALEAAGAVPFDFGRDVAWYHFGGWKKRFPSGVLSIGVSRPLLEAEVRRRVFALPNVRRLDDREATGLATTPDRARITGAATRSREGAEETLDADLVVDASGRGSRLPRWLEGLGYGRPPETVVAVDVAYAGRVYRAPDPSPYPWKMLYVIGQAPESRRLGALLAIEGGRYICVLAGLAGDHPPSDPEAYLAFARTLPTSDVHRALSELEPLGDVETYKFPANVRRRYERMARFPEALAVVGDAMASFNPMYGQGMTTSALAALELGASLVAQRRRRGRGHVDGLGRAYHAAAAKAADAPWAMTTGEDLRFPEVTGDRPLHYPLMKWYLAQVHRACTVDTEVYGAFLRAMHMLDGPEKLLAPRAALRVLSSARRARASKL